MKNYREKIIKYLILIINKWRIYKPKIQGYIIKYLILIINHIALFDINYNVYYKISNINY
mgnify:CR=1 FL=1